jgi:hypothetical protein
MSFVPILDCLRTLPDSVFLYTEPLDFQIKRRPWNSKLGSCTIWPGNFPLTFRKSHLNQFLLIALEGLCEKVRRCPATCVLI